MRGPEASSFGFHRPRSSFSDRGQGRLVDDIEVGRPLEERVRIAVHVDDLDGAATAVMTTGTEPQAGPVDTPWGDRNRRFKTPDGLQLTLFQPPL